MKTLIALFLLIGLATSVFADELSDLKKELTLIRSRMETAQAQAEASQERLQRIQQLYPSLQAEEKSLVERIQLLEKTPQPKEGTK